MSYDGTRSYGYAPDQRLTPSEASVRLDDILDRAGRLRDPGPEDTVEVATEVREVLSTVPVGDIRGSARLADVLDEAGRVMTNLPFPPGFGGLSRRDLLVSIEGLQDAARGEFSAQEPLGDFAEGVGELRSAAGVSEEMGQAVGDVVRCARQGRALGDHLGRLEAAIDNNDFPAVANLSAHVAFHMGRLGACGEDFDHQRVAVAVEDLVTAMRRGDEMSAMSALDRLRTMESG